jgi:hypothetical protein
MTDLETTGDIFSIHEILEIGLVLFDQQTFEILDTLNVKVKPEHIENAVPAALSITDIHNKAGKMQCLWRKQCGNMQRKLRKLSFAHTM